MLHVAVNKQELFSFLADGSIPACSRSDALVLITQGVNVNILAGQTVDTDVVVIATYSFDKLQVVELWIHVVVGKNVRLIPSHNVVDALGPQKFQALPLFHALTGCDTVSSFLARAKSQLGMHGMCFQKPPFHQRTSLLIGKWL